MILVSQHLLTTQYLQVFMCPDDSFTKFCIWWELQMDFYRNYIFQTFAIYVY